MGNAHTKEVRETGPGSRLYDAGGNHAAGSSRHHGEAGRRTGRREMSALELLTGTPAPSSRRDRDQTDAPFERRETKQEREARRLERERVARVKERERSMKEEHVDGGFLVTMGVYTASEDFTKSVVRQLQIERRLAPFWRGLDDFETTWAEHQIIAAARGLDIPPADEVPENLVPQPRSLESPNASLQNLNSLTVPMGPRTLSAASDRTGSNPGSALPSPTSPAPPRGSSSLKPHKKALAAALSISSRNNSQQDIAPREISLPHDPFVNGQPLEVFLYKDGIECPICCMYYPRYLNKTRCCDQFICSECFVQIKRPDPHLPEHHGDSQQNGTQTPDGNAEEQNSEELIMEPACCPYCTQTEFGITYEPPPFRRGLTYAFGSGLGSMSTAMSSSSSLNSGLSPTSATTPANPNRRRAQSLSVNAPGVILTDRIRPDWSTKLATARAHQRRRAAAADALHHAAFVMGNSEATRSLFSRTSRFSRRPTVTSTNGNESPGSTSTVVISANGGAPSPPLEAGARTSSARLAISRERLDAAHLESMMMAEAIRLSLADEEERRKKAEKEAKKEAKKREKEERKANRRASVYGSGATSSASASSLSLGFGRKRGNSNAPSITSPSLRAEASIAAASATAAQNSETPPSSPKANSDAGTGGDKGKGVERTENASLPIPISAMSRGSSHLRQMSNASSVSSSGLDTLPGSYNDKRLAADDPSASAVSLGGGKSDDEGAGTESMFNFRSLAQMVGVPIDGEDISPTTDADGKPVNATTTDRPQLKDTDSDKASAAHHEHIEDNVGADSTSDKNDDSPTAADPATEETGESATPLAGEPDVALGGKGLKLNTSDTSLGAIEEHQNEESSGALSTGQFPSVVITPETPAPGTDGDDTKQLGHAEGFECVNEVTQ
ncbi:hypothetical protein BX600DRAFT_517725 [Xylariales sp. PMI_506]|nr:hypothetical protein BX600DRAFT_517725 [Xylariales sp. PMI_506]